MKNNVKWELNSEAVACYFPKISVIESTTSTIIK